MTELPRVNLFQFKHILQKNKPFITNYYIWPPACLSPAVFFIIEKEVCELWQSADYCCVNAIRVLFLSLTFSTHCQRVIIIFTKAESQRSYKLIRPEWMKDHLGTMNITLCCRGYLKPCLTFRKYAWQGDTCLYRHLIYFILMRTLGLCAQHNEKKRACHKNVTLNLCIWFHICSRKTRIN